MLHKVIAQNFSKVQPGDMKHSPNYRSLTKEQLLCLDKILLPYSPLISESLPVVPRDSINYLLKILFL